MTADRTHTVAGTTWTEGAAVHPRFLRVGPWVLSLVVATLFVLSFATSYAALHDYALQLQFRREFAIVFPLVLDAVISVLAVTVLLERALRRRTVTVKGWQFALRLPPWPLLSLWCYFGGSVAGNVAHAPPIRAAQLVAAVPPISAALTFHLLLRLLDRAPALRAIAEAYEERTVEEQERALQRRARRARLKTGRTDRSAPRVTPVLSGATKVSNNGDYGRSVFVVNDAMERPSPTRLPRLASGSDSSRRSGDGPFPADIEDLRRRVLVAVTSGGRVTGGTVGEWLGVSARTGRRRLSALLNEDPAFAQAIEQAQVDGRARPSSPESDQ